MDLDWIYVVWTGYMAWTKGFDGVGSLLAVDPVQSPLSIFKIIKIALATRNAHILASQTPLSSQNEEMAGSKWPKCKEMAIRIGFLFYFEGNEGPLLD